MLYHPLLPVSVPVLELVRLYTMLVLPKLSLNAEGSPVSVNLKLLCNYWIVISNVFHTLSGHFIRYICAIVYHLTALLQQVFTKLIFVAHAMLVTQCENVIIKSIICIFDPTSQELQKKKKSMQRACTNVNTVLFYKCIFGFHGNHNHNLNHSWPCHCHGWLSLKVSGENGNHSMFLKKKTTSTTVNK